MGIKPQVLLIASLIVMAIPNPAIATTVPSVPELGTPGVPVSGVYGDYTTGTDWNYNGATLSPSGNPVLGPTYCLSFYKKDDWMGYGCQTTDRFQGMVPINKQCEKSWCASLELYEIGTHFVEFYAVWYDHNNGCIPIAACREGERHVVYGPAAVVPGTGPVMLLLEFNDLKGTSRSSEFTLEYYLAVDGQIRECCLKSYGE